MRGTVRSISKGGLFFAGAALPIGKSVELSLELPAGKIQAIGEVRYHASSEQGAGMGIRFTRIQQDHLQQIDQFVAANAH